jgi:hypothetical protein
MDTLTLAKAALGPYLLLIAVALERRQGTS